MADAGRHLIPEALRKGKDMKDYTDETLEFIEWEGPLEDPRVLLAKNDNPRAKNTEEEEVVDYRYESLSAKFRLILPSGQTPPPGYVQSGPVGSCGDKHHPGDPSSSHSAEEAHNKYLRLPSGLIIQELPSAFLTESDWARRCSSPSPPDSGVLSPDLADLTMTKMRVTMGVWANLESDLEQTPSSQKEFYKIRDEEIRRKEEEERLAREAEERAQELEASMMGDSVMRYLKMVRRNSKNADTKKAERFRSMNYDPTLRNIKAKYLYKDDEITTKTVEVQCDDSILHLLKQCETPVDSLPYFWDRRIFPAHETLLRDKDFYSHLYSGDLSGIEGGSIPEDYYHYLESWYRAQKAQGGAKPPPGPGIYIPVSTLQNLRSSMPTLSSTAASTCMVSRSTTSLSGHSTSSPKSLFSSVLGKSTSSISKKLRPHGRSKSQSISSISTSSWCPQ
ncbi:Putative LOC101743771, partial [Caligus rogercresseyi]